MQTKKLPKTVQKHNLYRTKMAKRNFDMLAPQPVNPLLENFKFLNDKEILTELSAFYTQLYIANVTHIEQQLISNLMKSTQMILSKEDRIALLTFFNDHVQRLSKPTPISMVIRDKNYSIVDTPDGFVTINKFHVKKTRNCLHLKTAEFSLQCSDDHLVQTESNITNYVHASELIVGQLIKTRNGYQAITEINNLGALPVYDIEVNHPEHRYWTNGISSHNSGKSFLTGNIIKNAQDQGAFILVVDSENALDEMYMNAIGVDTDNNYSYVSVKTIPQTLKVISTFLAGYRDEYEDDLQDAPKVVIAVDSLAMLMTDAEANNYDKGDAKGDQGQHAKQIKALLKTLVQDIKDLNVSMVVTGHAYPANAEQLMKGEGAWVVNEAMRFSLSQIILVNKLKLKGATAADIEGIRMKCEAFKTRFSKPFQKIVIEVPYESGMDKTSGIMEIAEATGVLTRSGAWYSVAGNDKKFQGKNLNTYLDDILAGIEATKAKIDVSDLTSNLVEAAE